MVQFGDRRIEEPLSAFSQPDMVNADIEAGQLAGARKIILENLGLTPLLVDEIIRNCQFSPAVVLTVLLELELAGRLERHPGN